MKLPHWMKHDWTKWEEYKQLMINVPGILTPKEQRGNTYRTIEDWQRRECKICGKVQREEIRGS